MLKVASEQHTLGRLMQRICFHLLQVELGMIQRNGAGNGDWGHTDVALESGRYSQR